MARACRPGAGITVTLSLVGEGESLTKVGGGVTNADGTYTFGSSVWLSGLLKLRSACFQSHWCCPVHGGGTCSSEPRCSVLCYGIRSLDTHTEPRSITALLTLGTFARSVRDHVILSPPDRTACAPFTLYPSTPGAGGHQSRVDPAAVQARAVG